MHPAACGCRHTVYGSYFLHTLHEVVWPISFIGWKYSAPSCVAAADWTAVRTSVRSQLYLERSFAVYGKSRMANEAGKWWFERHETKNEIFIRFIEDSIQRFGPIDLLTPSENVFHKVKVKYTRVAIRRMVSWVHNIYGTYIEYVRLHAAGISRNTSCAVGDLYLGLFHKGDVILCNWLFMHTGHSWWGARLVDSKVWLQHKPIECHFCRCLRRSFCKRWFEHWCRLEQHSEDSNLVITMCVVDTQLYTQNRGKKTLWFCAMRMYSYMSISVCEHAYYLRCYTILTN